METENKEKRGRGRPVGSKNAVKGITDTMAGKQVFGRKTLNIMEILQAANAAAHSDTYTTDESFAILGFVGTMLEEHKVPVTLVEVPGCFVGKLV